MSGTLKPRVINDVLVARHLHHLATDQARSKRNVANFAAANLLQDALEAFIRAAITHLELVVEERADFAKMYDEINKAMGGNVLSNRTRIVQINRIRVSAKHHGITPSQGDLDGAAEDVLRFFEDTSVKVFGIPFVQINLINDIEDRRLSTAPFERFDPPINVSIRSLLEEAQAYLEVKDFAAVLTKCRMAFYLVFERDTDITPHATSPEKRGALWLYQVDNTAAFARSKQYYEAEVHEPFDVLVPDVTKIDADLLKDGIDPTVYWNILQLTPAVYLHRERGWLVRNDLTKSLEDMEDHATYVFDKVVDMLLRKQERQRSRRWIEGSRPRPVARVVNRGAPIYEKADRTSKILAHVPHEEETVDLMASLPGLNDDDTYWQIVANTGSRAMRSIFSSIYGYMHESDLALSGTEEDRVASVPVVPSPPDESSDALSNPPTARPAGA